ncbi:hypothetical protein AB0I81_15335 [Nonomuraea sp. NPDC050404]|uniref:hypothetical protein n=1 Tax=Nonomuraea sp. NPDC050404 TaxID=3155783 RepID=UPI003401B191
MVELPSRLYGLTEMREELDIIRYQPYTTALHQEHIILHELAHLLLGHDPARLHRIVFPSLDPKMVATVLGQTNYLGRTTYEERVEYEAEYVATRILERARRLPDRSPAEYPGRNSRLERTLGRRPR